MSSQGDDDQKDEVMVHETFHLNDAYKGVYNDWSSERILGATSVPGGEPANLEEARAYIATSASLNRAWKDKGRVGTAMANALPQWSVGGQPWEVQQIIDACGRVPGCMP